MASLRSRSNVALAHLTDDIFSVILTVRGLWSLRSGGDEKSSRPARL
jgi:hypothetical protein